MLNMRNLSLNDMIAQSEENVVSDMDGSKVMLSIKNGKYYNLGEIGGVIWDLIETPITIDKLISTLIDNYEVERNECEEQVISFLDLLMKEHLILVN